MGDTNFSGPVNSDGGYEVDGDTVIDGKGELVGATGGEKQYVVLYPSTSTTYVVDTADISSGSDITGATLVRAELDYPRNLLYTLTDASSDTLEATFTVAGNDQFGQSATETVTVDYDSSATEAGTQVFSTIDSVNITSIGNAATSDTASVGVAISSDVASFGLPDHISAVTNVKSINWIDNGTTKAQNIDSTSVVTARDCIRPEQNVAAADCYVIRYESSATT